jgi:hypothetical protein
MVNNRSKQMQLAAINATKEQFEAALGINTFDDLCVVLSYLSENEELIRQLCKAYTGIDVVFCSQFNHVFLDSEKAFGKPYSKEDIDALMVRMRQYVVPRGPVRGFDDFDVNYSAIKRLAGIGVNVAINFIGDNQTDKEEETSTSVRVMFVVVQYAASFMIEC